MKNRKERPHQFGQWLKLGALALGGAACVLGSGCAEEEPVAVVQPPPPPPPPAPEPPAVTSVEQLMADLNIDPRINLPEDKAPAATEDRKAVLEFFDAFARANTSALKGMLTQADQRELGALMGDPSWKQTTSQIKKIDVRQTGTNPVGQKCVLAVFEVGAGANANFQAQLWAYTTDGESAVFEAESSPPGILDRLSGDWIEAWYRIIAEEEALASKPDEEFEVVQQDLQESSSGSGGMSGGSPSPGGLAPGARPRPTTPRRPGRPGGM